MLKRTLAGLLLTAAGLLVHPAARADIFRCVGAGGTTMFTDLPCPSGMRTTNVITSAKSVERGDEAEVRSADRDQPAARDAERRRIEQDLAAREDALRRAEQELAIREEENYRRAEEDARLSASWPREDIVPAAPYGPPAWYPVVVVPASPCATARCFPVPHRPPHKPGGPQHHDPHGNHYWVRGDGGHGGSGAMPPRGDGRSFAKQRS